ncbi:cbb3-type cytochrome c oxidase subunit 3 [Ensifer sp. ENS07]|uniref:cbb3-type cytochrome c oxidase subunit 3 n=1 Tax=unclassified Ensifer TaxID=2633371 RepID=UPI00177FC468|nr:MULTISPECIES: cbb3-type cytochrome c oxidase subunit 3 [unclassified Ensifer]MBD9508045.1 cbb3-type cytochrome c oxidase subunit 3 [Ensifer sp. ENS10]MBD9637459.1 cbb3-type cytochrome c oxidase subunit 3 [Ensifer sp. ENS07]
MLQSIISSFLNVWLVIAVTLFGGILWHVFRPSARRVMELHALIPFEEERRNR